MKAIRLIKFFFDAMYYQFFIFNRDKFRLENPHERAVMLFCGTIIFTCNSVDLSIGQR